MFQLSKIYIIILICLYGAGGFAQTNAEQLMIGLRDKTNTISSFEVKALIKVDVDFINIDDREIIIRYTAPDQFSFDGQGLVLLPRNGVQMEYMTLLNNNFTAIGAGQEKVRQTDTEIIKIIPESIESDIILAQLWVDPTEIRLMRMKTFTKSSGSYIIDFEYAGLEDILPSRLEVVFDINNLSLPVKMMNDFMKSAEQGADSLTKEAKVIIEYSDYNIKQQPL